MAIAKIEPTGCCVRKGKVQLRFSFYLESTDPRYEEHHVQVLDAEDIPTGEWRNNPFHNHFVYVNADVCDDEVRQLLADSLEEFFGIWSRGEDILKVWKSKGRLIAGAMSVESIRKCQRKVSDIKNRSSDFKVVRKV